MMPLKMSLVVKVVPNGVVFNTEYLESVLTGLAQIGHCIDSGVRFWHVSISR